MSFDKVMSNVGCSNIFLKMDIEGYGYRILDEVVVNSDKIVGMVIEFHDCDINMDKLCDFVDKIGMNVVHVHANNYGPVNTKCSIPVSLEITFSQNGARLDDCLLPHPLDMPNNSQKEEITLQFA